MDARIERTGWSLAAVGLLMIGVGCAGGTDSRLTLGAPSMADVDEPEEDCLGGVCLPADTDGAPFDTGLDEEPGTDSSGDTGGSDPSDDEGSDETGEPSEDESGDEGGDDDETGGEETGAAIEPSEVCYPGPDEDGTVCFAVVAADPYDYPEPYGPNYDAPVRFLVVDAVDLGLWVAPSFILAELIDPDAGDYQVVQTHAVEMLQEVRDAVGPLIVRSSYRSPLFNAGAGGVVSSRHLYGDAFDLEPVDDTPENLTALYEACVELGAGYVETYDNGHVHCDWRNVPADPAFYDAGAANAVEPELTAAVVANGRWVRVQTEGDAGGEGPLSRRWTAYDNEGRVLSRSDALQLELPRGTDHVEVVVGDRLTLVQGGLTQ